LFQAALLEFNLEEGIGAVPVRGEAGAAYGLETHPKVTFGE